MRDPRNVYGFPPERQGGGRERLQTGANGASTRRGGVLGDVVLDAKLETRVQRLATATANTRANGAPFRNVMLYGPPGTGKTMMAKRLARHSGLDYALMTGGDVAPLGSDAVTRIHELFDWASTSRRGLLLFIDEADAFLAKRTGGAATGAGSATTTTANLNHPGGVRSALNALLYRTGELSRDVVLVIATNRPEDLDAAVLDRMDESMEFGLPDAAARERMLRLYFDKLVVRGEDAGDDAPAQGLLGALGIGKGGRRGGGKKGASIAVDEAITDAVLSRRAKMDGFSGRETETVAALRRGVRRLERLTRVDPRDVRGGVAQGGGARQARGGSPCRSEEEGAIYTKVFFNASVTHYRPGTARFAGRPHAAASKSPSRPSPSPHLRRTRSRRGAPRPPLVSTSIAPRAPRGLGRELPPFLETASTHAPRQRDHRPHLVVPAVHGLLGVRAQSPPPGTAGSSSSRSCGSSARRAIARRKRRREVAPSVTPETSAHCATANTSGA